MSYDLERLAIETYLKTGWTTTPIGFDAQTFTPVANSISLHITSGDVIQGSIGRTTNRLVYVGVVQIMIYTAPAAGSKAWRDYATALEALFREARLTNAGVAITAIDQEFIRFSPQGQHPYIAGQMAEPAFHVTTFNAPFNRFNI